MRNCGIQQKLNDRNVKISNINQHVQISSTIKLIFDDITKEIVHWHFVRMKGREVVFIMKSIVFHELSKDMGLFED